MLTVDTRTIKDQRAISAPADDVVKVLNDVAGWPQLHRMHLLGEGGVGPGGRRAATTVAGARRNLRRLLSNNSMGNLPPAKAYAEKGRGW